jgi:hypothetical protein
VWGSTFPPTRFIDKLRGGGVRQVEEWGAVYTTPLKLQYNISGGGDPYWKTKKQLVCVGAYCTHIE